MKKLLFASFLAGAVLLAQDQPDVDAVHDRHQNKI